MAYRKNWGSRFLARDKIKFSNMPMIDITFLLLIFFMATLHLNPQEGSLTQRMEKDLSPFRPPESESPKLHLQENICIGFVKDGDVNGIFVGDKVFQGENRFEQLRKFLLRIYQVDSSSQKVVLYPERDTGFGEIFRVMNLCYDINQLTSRSGSPFLDIHFNVVYYGSIPE